MEADDNYYIKWVKTTFTKFHNNIDEFTAAVLKYFFLEIYPEEIFEDSEKYVFRSIDDKLYVLKCDFWDEYRTSYKSYKKFIKYYSNSDKLKWLLGNLYLQRYAKNRRDSKSSSDELTASDNKPININNSGSNNPLIAGNDNQLISNSYNTNNIVNNKNVTYNAIYGLTPNYTFENLIEEMLKKYITLNPTNPKSFLENIQSVIRANQNKEKNYTILTKKGDFLVDRTYFVPLGYYETNNDKIQDLEPYIVKEREFLLNKEGTQKLAADKKQIEKIYESFDKDLLWVERVIEQLWPICLHTINRQKQTNIMDVIKFREALKNMDNGEIYPQWCILFNTKNSKDFSGKLSTYLDDKSRKFKITKNKDGTFLVSSNKHPLMYKL